MPPLQVDEFEVREQDLGALSELVIGHDNSGLGPGWHLEQVEITDTKINQARPTDRTGRDGGGRAVSIVQGILGQVIRTCCWARTTHRCLQHKGSLQVRNVRYCIC